MKQSEIKGLATNDLIDRIEEETALLLKMKMNNVVSTISNPVRIRIIRRNIAKLKTEFRTRELEKNKSN